MGIILGLIAITLVLIFFEVLLPGGILGGLAFVCMLAATWLGFADYGLFGGLIIFFSTLLASTVLLFIEFKLMAKTTYGKQFFLSTSISGHSNKAQAEDSIIGQKGTALTRLNPSGKVSVNGKGYEAYSQDGYIENGLEITVVAQDDFKLIIRKL